MISAVGIRKYQEKPAAGMAWAVDRTTKAPVYVGKLSREQTGLRCRCICPACGAALQAVNAGLEPRKGRVPFFRHHVGQQGPRCKYRVAELAALRLLAEKGVIVIPAPRRRAIHSGLSGALYTAEAVGVAQVEKIVERRLVSEVAALLTLESGRQVALVLRGHQDVGELGSVFAVIEVRVDDPEVAWLSPEEILSRADLQAGWLCTVQHEAHGALQAEADELARQQALEQLDVDPAELGLPVGATRKQASESLIHWAVKDVLLTLGAIQSPELRRLVSAVDSAGHVHTVPVLLPRTRLEISEVADEVLFDGYRSDIVCVARESRDGSKPPFRLLIEVAVTSKVKPEKLALIAAADVACIELDVFALSEGGVVTRSRLRELVAGDLSSKVWLHHPELKGLMDQAQAKADAARDLADRRRAESLAREEEIRQAAEERYRHERARAAAKIAWARGLDRPGALRELRVLLGARRAKKPEYTSNGMVWQSGEFEAAIGQTLTHSGIDRELLSPRGIVPRLEAVIYSARAWRKPLDVLNVLGVGEFPVPFEVRPWLGLLHMAIDELGSLIEDGRAGYEKQRETVLESLAAGERAYARPVHLDEPLMEMFSELRDLMTREFGTVQHADRVKEERAAEERKLWEQQQLEEQEARLLQIRRQEEADAERERLRVPDAIASVAYQWSWSQNLKFPKTGEDAVANLQYSAYKNAGSELLDLVRDGFVARGEGQTLGAWLSSRRFDSTQQVAEARAVLEAAWLLEMKAKLPATKLKR